MNMKRSDYLDLCVRAARGEDGAAGAEYIERSAGVSILRAKSNMAVLMDAAPYFEKAAQMLEKLPSADVATVVRCKRCKYSCKDGNGRICEGYWYELSEFAVPVKDDDFCSHGEPKEGPHADDHD